MIVRIVKMHFSSAFIADFKILFEAIQPQIAAFPGCLGVKLLQDETRAELFFTISNWQSANDLENYRMSALFQTTWAKVKPSFLSKAEAWSLLEQ